MIGMKNVAMDWVGHERVRITGDSSCTRTYRNAQAVAHVLVLCQLVLGMMKRIFSRLEIRVFALYVPFESADMSLGGPGVLVRLL